MPKIYQTRTNDSCCKLVSPAHVRGIDPPNSLEDSDKDTVDIQIEMEMMTR